MAFNFSANTGYLWKELPFLDRIRSAKKYGFHSVELHDEAHFEDLGDLKSLLKEVGLPVNSMNIRMGPSFGCAAIPDRQHIARHDIREAARLAQEIGAKALHILSGFSEQTPEAFETFVENLEYALDHSTLTIVIEPVCEEQLPGYFLRTLAQAGQVLDAIKLCLIVTMCSSKAVIYWNIFHAMSIKLVTFKLQRQSSAPNRFQGRLTTAFYCLSFKLWDIKGHLDANTAPNPKQRQA